MLKPIVQAALVCSTHTAKTADCAAPIKLIHVVSDSCAGYLVSVNAYNYQEVLIAYNHV